MVLPRLCPRIAAVVLCVALAYGCLAAQSPGPLGSGGAEDEGGSLWWQQRSHLRQGVIALAGLNDSDSLTGVSLAYGIRFTGDDVPGCGTIWLSRQVQDSERAVSARGDMAMWVLARDWGAIGPLLGVGFEYRDDGKEQDFGGLLAIGVDLTLWTRLHWQFSLDAVRVFGVSAETRNELRLSFAFAHDALTIGELQH